MLRQDGSNRDWISELVTQIIHEESIGICKAIVYHDSDMLVASSRTWTSYIWKAQAYEELSSVRVYGKV